jgi:hypothetical protein
LNRREIGTDVVCYRVASGLDDGTCANCKYREVVSGSATCLLL